jgi:cytochrome c oxidase assembly protein Cox11
VPNISRSGVSIGPIVGTIIGVLVLLILGVAIAVVILYLVRLRSTGGNYSTGRRASEKKVMVDSKPCMHSITEQQQSAENWTDSKLDMEQNVAYGSPTDHDAQISLTSNHMCCLLQV